MSSDFFRKTKTQDPANIAGRMKIRKSDSTNANKIIGLWDLEAPEGSRKAALKEFYLKAIDGVDAVEKFKAEAAKSGKFTEDGMRGAVLEHALSQVVPDLARGRKAVEAAKRERDQIRSKLTLEAPDKTDAAPAIRRQEMRAWLRSMTNEDRNAWISRNRETMNPEIAAAIVEMPLEMTGVLATDRDDIINRAMAIKHGDKLAEIAELDRAIQLAETALDASRAEIQKESGITDSREFDRLAEPHEKKAVAPSPWLKRHGDKIVKIHWDDKTNSGSASIPTQEDLDNGVYYSDVTEFKNANGGRAA